MNRTVTSDGNVVYEITIPCIPPSINHYYGNRALGKRVIRYITAKGKAFKEIVKRCIKVDHLIEEPLHLTIVLGFNNHRRHDIDNFSKGILDSLNGIFYKDDSQIVSLSITKEYSTSGFEYTKIKAFPAPAMQSGVK